MKKLLLSLGSLSMVILPISVALSCSSTTPTLETETARFNASVKTINNNLTTIEATELINKTVKPEEKLAALKTIANVPNPNKGFSIEVISARIDQGKPTSIYVKINVKEESTTKIQEATFTVTDLVFKLLTLEEEFARFNISTKTTNPLIRAIDIVENIQKASGTENKLAQLKTVANVPNVSAGFFIEFESAIVNADVLSTIEVKIIIEEIATQDKKVATFVVTGLVEQIPTLSDEIEKFIPKPTKTPLEEAAAAATKINTAMDNAKLEILKSLVDLPKLSKDFDIKVTSASVNASVFTTLDVKIIIIEKSTLDSQGTIFQITGLKESLPTFATEIAKLASPVTTISPFSSPQYVKFVLDLNETNDDKYQALQTFADIWDLSTGYTATFGAITIDTTNTSMSIQITVTDTNLTTDNTKVVTFTITDLAPKMLADEEKKFVDTAVETPTPITTAIEAINNASTPEEKMAALLTFVTPPKLDINFSMEIISAEQNAQTPTSMNVIIIITQRSDLTPETLTSPIIWVVTGFTNDSPA